MKKTKGKRGRPPGSKNKVKTDKKLVKSIEAVVGAVKRGRGKPRKDSTPTPTLTLPVTQTEPVVKRGRGRPKKVVNANVDKFVVSDVESSDDPDVVTKVLTGMKKRGRKSKEEESIFERVEVKEEDENGWITRHQEFKNVPPEYMIEPEMVARGARVLVAPYPDFYKIYFKKYHLKSGAYPRGGIEVYNANNARTENYRINSVAVHPKGGSIRLVEGSEGELMPVGPVPVTNRDERFARKAARREKKMAKEAKKKIKADIKEAKLEIKKLNKQKKGLKPKERKAVREQIKSLKEAIVQLKADFVKATAVAKGAEVNGTD